MPGPASPTGPSFDELAQSVSDRMAALGHPVVITSRRRTAAEQARLYAKGRSKPGGVVTELSGAPGQESRHQLGLAADFAFVGPDGQPSYQDSHPWQLLGQVAKEHGLEWGGDWTTLKDRPHVQQSLRQRPVAKGAQVSEGYTDPASVKVTPGLPAPPGLPAAAAAAPASPVQPGILERLTTGVNGLVDRERASLARRNKPAPAAPAPRQAPVSVDRSFTVPGSVKVTSPAATAPARAAAAPARIAAPAPAPAAAQPDADAIAAKYGGQVETGGADAEGDAAAAAIAAKYGGQVEENDAATPPSTYSTYTPAAIEQPSTGGMLRNAVSDVVGMGRGIITGVHDFAETASGRPWNTSLWQALPDAPQALGQEWQSLKADPVAYGLKKVYDNPVTAAATVAGAGELGGRLLTRTGMMPRVLTQSRSVLRPPPTLPAAPAGTAPGAYRGAIDSMVERGGAAKAAASAQYDEALAGPLGDVRVPTGEMLPPPAPLPTPGQTRGALREPLRDPTAGMGEHPNPVISDVNHQGFQAVTDRLRSQAMPTFDEAQQAGSFRGERTVQPHRWQKPLPTPGQPVPETVSFREAHEAKGLSRPFRAQGEKPVTPKERLAFQERKEIEGAMDTAASQDEWARHGKGLYDQATAAYNEYMNLFQRGPVKKAMSTVPAQFNEFMLHPEKWNTGGKGTAAVRYQAGELPRKMQPQEVIGRFERAAGADSWKAARHHVQADLINSVTEDGVVDGVKLKAELTRLDRHGVTDRLLPDAADLRAYAEHRISQQQFQRRLRAAAKIAGIATGGLIGTELYRNYDRLKELF